MKKRGLEFSFTWIFAFIAGAVILFLAIYFASQLIKTGQYEVDSKTAKQLSILFDPMETGLASAKSTKININRETRFYVGCENTGSFGELKIAASSKSFGGWSEKGVEKRINNKYVFSDNLIEGKEFFFISRPFEFPFKISEIIMMYNKEYCFINADEIEVIGGKIKTENCSADSVRVCFDSSGCDINVVGLCEGYNCESVYDYGYVEKDNDKLYYTGNLLYGAIFSSPELYDCEVKRLMKRLSLVSSLYREEAIFLSGRGINTNLEGDLLAIASLSSNVKSSAELIALREYINQVEVLNENLGDKAIW